MVDHLYALKVNKLRLPFMEMQDKMEQENKTKKVSTNKENNQADSDIDESSADSAATSKKAGGFMGKNRARKPLVKKEKKG